MITIHIGGYLMYSDIVNETIETLLEFIPRVISETKKTAEFFHTDREATGLKNMLELIEAYGWIIDAFNGIQQNGALTNIKVDEFKQLLLDIEQSMEIQDYIGVSDLLEYEISEILENWYTDILKEIEGK